MQSDSAYFCLILFIYEIPDKPEILLNNAASFSHCAREAKAIVCFFIKSIESIFFMFLLF